MRALLLRTPTPVRDRPLEVVELPDPVAGPGQLVMRVHACAVCRTDLQLAERDLTASALPVVPGHQAVGVVESLGAGVVGWSVSDRVAAMWLAGTCGACARCREGRENLCARARFTGWDSDGGFAERMVVAADFALRPPSGFDDVHAAPLGARWTGGYDETPPEPLDAAITFAPAGDVVVSALGALDRGGTVAINAIHLDRVPSFSYERLWWERTLRSVANVTRADADEFLALAAEIPIRTRADVFALDEGNDALARLARGEVRGAAVLVP